MLLVKGSYVRCKKTLKIGVVSSTANKFLYVDWLLASKPDQSDIHHYLDYTSLLDVEELPFDQTTKDLELLRSKILR